MATNLKDVFELDRRFWHSVAVFAVGSIKRRTEGGKDRTGKTFPNYTKEYAELKQAGFYGKKGKRYKQYSGRGLEQQTTPPNFALTRDTMRDLKELATTGTGTTIGWADKAALIVAAHEQRKKYRVGGITPTEHDDIVKIADKHFAKRWNDGRSFNLKVSL